MTNTSHPEQHKQAADAQALWSSLAAMAGRSGTVSPDEGLVGDIQDFTSCTLRSKLPYSLPLYRRCQFHTKRQAQAPDAEVWCARVSRQSHGNTSQLPWLAAYIDLTKSGQTQIWVYGSWEADFSTVPDPYQAVQSSEHFSVYQRLFDSLFRRLKHHHIPRLANEPPTEWLRLKAEGKIVSEPFSTSKVLFGTIAECHWPFLDHYSLRGLKAATAREDRPYLKYIITSTQQSLEALTVPEGLHLVPMPEQHLQTMVDRTRIPRTVETLRQLPSLGLFDQDGRPVAWGLIGKDASLSSLHTEPEYRGRGFAELVAKGLMAEQQRFFVEMKDDTDAVEDIVYSHADVSDKNIASNRVMQKLAGKVMWRVAWIELDLGTQLAT